MVCPFLGSLEVMASSQNCYSYETQMEFAIKENRYFWLLLSLTRIDIKHVVRCLFSERRRLPIYFIWKSLLTDRALNSEKCQPERLYLDPRRITFASLLMKMEMSSGLRWLDCPWGWKRIVSTNSDCSWYIFYNSLRLWKPHCSIPISGREMHNVYHPTATACATYCKDWLTVYLSLYDINSL